MYAYLDVLTFPRAAPTQVHRRCCPASRACPPNLFTGTSGWAYPTWKPGFYPSEVPSRAFLHHYASKLTAVEVNYTFRTLPSRPQLEGWLAATPPGFRFSFKAPQRITHFSRLRDCADDLERFLEALTPARDAGKFGPLLFQLPPNFAADLPRLKLFLQLPDLCSPNAPKISFEFRHPSWFAEDTYALLREAGAALCVADTDDLATPDIQTAAFRCYRLRRDGGYQPAELEAFAECFSALTKDGEVYVFFRHQDEPTGALNALGLLEHAAGHAAGHVLPYTAISKPQVTEAPKRGRTEPPKAPIVPKRKVRPLESRKAR